MSQAKRNQTPVDVPSFESEYSRLNGIVAELEEGSVSLEEMLKLYEEGVMLAGRLSMLLKEAELRVEKLASMHEEMLSAASDLEIDETDISE